MVDAHAVELVIADNGRGFDGDTAPRSGRGLIDMRTVSNALGAELTVESHSAGTRIRFRWPGASYPASDMGDSAAGPRTSPG